MPPRDVPGLEDVGELAAGGLVEADDPSLGFTCAVRAADTVVCWGDNWSLQLGSDPESTVRSEPALVLRSPPRPQPGWVPPSSTWVGSRCAA